MTTIRQLYSNLQLQCAQKCVVVHLRISTMRETVDAKTAEAKEFCIQLSSCMHALYCSDYSKLVCVETFCITLITMGETVDFKDPYVVGETKQLTQS